MSSKAVTRLSLSPSVARSLSLSLRAFSVKGTQDKSDQKKKNLTIWIKDTRGFIFYKSSLFCFSYFYSNSTLSPSHSFSPPSTPTLSDFEWERRRRRRGEESCLPGKPR